MNEFLFLQAFKGTNSRVPVWFMRQAGRYLPEYQAIKKKHSLQKMFDTPELAAEITCLPVGILGVDAAILFADILTLPVQMGFPVDIGGVIEKVDDPAYATALGTLLWGVREGQRRSSFSMANFDVRRAFGHVGSWFKNLLP